MYLGWLRHVCSLGGGQVLVKCRSMVRRLSGPHMHSACQEHNRNPIQFMGRSSFQLRSEALSQKVDWPTQAC